MILLPKKRVALAFCWKKQLRIWEGKVGARPGDRSMEFQWLNEPKVKDGEVKEYPPLQLLKTTMDEPFRLFADQNSFYFVMISGRVHACSRKPGATKTTAVWQDAKRPVHVLLHRVDDNQTYAFTAATKSSKAGYFVLGRKPVWKAIPKPSFPRYKPTDPLPTMSVYAEFVNGLQAKKP